MVTDFTYNAITTDFWANLDAVGPPETWEHHGLTGDAKGQPVQSNYPSHGSSPCLIRKIMVGAAYAWRKTRKHGQPKARPSLKTMNLEIDVTIRAKKSKRSPTRSEHGEGRRGRGPLLRRRTIGDRYANSSITATWSSTIRSLDHRLLRPEGGYDQDPSGRRCLVQAAIEQAQDWRSGAGQPGSDAAGQAAAELHADRRGAAAGGGLRAGRTRADGQAEHGRLREEGVARVRLHPEAPLDGCVANSEGLSATSATPKRASS